ncbi:9af30532-7a5b-49fa-85a3-9d7538ffefe9 [Thermothielavioides terrestris]|uniref:9af30532-7a5b-49fa-85a3-9d7538ffefe9 n=1 Tax=Thermothielavioides terrestris TaxID=2587410 RepID=A0A3S4F0P9_9PEZI|nr:9af30532-7a5b-49fa-85a3-9d7538ffefe9 [Thermothielavioides terrestris]
MADALMSGSAAWTGGAEFEGEYKERIDKFVANINHDALLAYASGLRGGRPCALSQEFSVGSFNLVRKIEFDDGLAWIARLRMPALPGEPSGAAGPHPSERIRLEMQSELDTMEFIRQKTNIPVPRVYAYDLDHHNTVGSPFSILEYFHGNTAEEVSASYPGDHEGIPAQFQEKFWRQVATIMTQLAAIRLPKIGSIFRDGANSFVVGPLVETGTGPYDSAAEFYADYPLALRKSFGEKVVAGDEELVQAFRSVAASFQRPSASDGDGPIEGFGLANYDLNPNNILVDREFNVLAVIDWDTVVAVPDAALYRFPFLMGVGCAVPGVVDTHPAVLKRQELGLRFAEVVETR